MSPSKCFSVQRLNEVQSGVCTEPCAVLLQRCALLQCSIFLNEDRWGGLTQNDNDHHQSVTSTTRGRCHCHLHCSIRPRQGSFSQLIGLVLGSQLIGLILGSQLIGLVLGSRSVLTYKRGWVCFYMFPLVGMASVGRGSCCFIRALWEHQRGECCIGGPAAGLCAAGCSDADGDGQQRADTGH